MRSGVLILCMTRECRTGLQNLCRRQGVIQESGEAAVRAFVVGPSSDEAWFIAGWISSEIRDTKGQTTGPVACAGSSIAWIAS